MWYLSFIPYFRLYGDRLIYSAYRECVAEKFDAGSALQMKRNNTSDADKNANDSFPMEKFKERVRADVGTKRESFRGNKYIKKSISARCGLFYQLALIVEERKH